MVREVLLDAFRGARVPPADAEQEGIDEEAEQQPWQPHPEHVIRPRFSRAGSIR